MTFQKFSILMLGLSFSLILFGCGQSKLETENASLKNQISKSELENKQLKAEIDTLKRLTNSYFESKKQLKTELDNPRKMLSGIFWDGTDTYDFRQDGTVIYNHDRGGGTYAIQNDRVIASLEELIPFGVESSITNKIQEIFRIDGNDLIHISFIANGETHIHQNKIRCIRQTQ